METPDRTPSAAHQPEYDDEGIVPIPTSPLMGKDEPLAAHRREPKDTTADLWSIVPPIGTPAATEWCCVCGRWNRMSRAFCVCGKFWQATERAVGLVKR